MHNYTLLCPKCKHSFIHQIKVQIHERKQREMTGIHITVENAIATIDQNIEKVNKDYRRNGLRIHFMCTFCNTKSIMSIEQWETKTYVNFR